MVTQKGKECVAMLVGGAVVLTAMVLDGATAQAMAASFVAAMTGLAGYGLGKRTKKKEGE